MPQPFVWFDNIGPNRDQTTDFLSKTFGWAANNIGQMTFLTNGEGTPFAAACEAMDRVTGWVPYIEVDDLPEAVVNARANGAALIAENMQGPAGVATFITDPGGAPIALWKRGEGM